MLDIKPQPSLAAVTAEMMWACAFATARVADAFAARGAVWWAQILHPPAERALRPVPPGPGMFPSSRSRSRAVESTDRSPQPPAPAEPRGATPTEPAFASYRSDGGHAAAQVILPR